MRGLPGTEILSEASSAWNSLEGLRQKGERALRFAFEDQWGDPVYVRDDEGCAADISEGEYICRHHRVPLKTNLIRPIMKNIEGQFRQLPQGVQCRLRTVLSAKKSESEMEAAATSWLQDFAEENEVTEVDASALNSLMLSGFCAQRLESYFHLMDQKRHLRVHNCNPERFFFNASQEDVRGWDISLIGELYDLSAADFEDAFATKPESGDGDVPSSSFYCSQDPSRVRVILVWKRQSLAKYPVHDRNTGTLHLASHQETSEGSALILCQEWHFYYLTPSGRVLREGVSPYPHKSHNYQVGFYPLVNGKLFNFIDDLIDSQKVLNRTLTEVNARLSSSLKSLKIYDTQFFPDMTAEQIADLIAQTGGLAGASVPSTKTVRDAVTQCEANVSMGSDFQLIQTQLQLMNDISGVNPALQGRTPSAGTSGSLYQQETLNGGLNTRGLLDSFRAFCLRRYDKALHSLPTKEGGFPGLDFAITFQSA
jgi:hypothetical protein